MNRERFLEIVRFLIAGAAGFAVQFVVLTLLVEKLGFGSVIANGIAFIVFHVFNRSIFRADEVPLVLKAAVDMSADIEHVIVLFQYFNYPVRLFADAAHFCRMLFVELPVIRQTVGPVDRLMHEHKDRQTGAGGLCHYGSKPFELRIAEIGVHAVPFGTQNNKVIPLYNVGIIKLRDIAV